MINATGVALSTNLGRAPLAEEAVAAAVAAAGYATLEWDAATGERGDRDAHLRDHLRALTGAEDAVAVNTNAGAVLLALVAVCAPGEALVSRGQLVEIGGGFRVPEILAASGCRLVEVGTTNRTRAADYAAAAGPGTRAILRVHPSNFRQLGFTEEAPLGALVEIGARARPAGDRRPRQRRPGPRRDPRRRAGRARQRRRGRPTSPASARTSSSAARRRGSWWAAPTRSPPSAGIPCTGRCASTSCASPRSRPPSPSIATPPRPGGGSPPWRCSPLGGDERMARARALAAAIGQGAEAVPTVGRVGGGALPLAELPSAAAAFIRSDPRSSLSASRLRALDPPVASRIHGGRVLLDVLALSERDLAELPGLVRAACDAAGDG